MQSLIVVASGRTTRKRVDLFSEEVDVTPYVGADDEGDFSSFGVGFSGVDSEGAKKGWLWGLVIPHHLIQSWRAMKILEEVPYVNVHGTLCACMQAVDELFHADARSLDELGALFSSRKEFRAVYAEIMAQAPTNEELVGMLRILEDNKLGISTHEIEVAFRRAGVRIEPSVQEILNRLCTPEEAAWKVAWAKREKEEREWRKARNASLWRRLFRRAA